MPTTSPAVSRRYHHGALAAALQEAVVALVSERGLGAVTMAECARRAGVSPGAPYRHYAGLQDLLLATADACTARWDARRAVHPVDLSDPERALRNLHDDFFAFAQDEPGAFILIFDGGLQRESATLATWSRAAFEQFVDLVAALTGTTRSECRITALGIIAIVFGHAKMSLAGFSGLTLQRASQLSRANVEMLLAGFTTEREGRQ
ncbi:TetR/AcrR family transcriptional regulator [Cryptosporangium aurantiacum]|uniref:Transcriptional regulator, TetR family n=1 Tax=Cryptosporangium aurantiacum TaxID=134849 RepID=A0A1M7PFG8_9ACTN|nr:TetR/AcrR family transcriptional regulator [Cryptosporangium aurantiacum]SHN15489.1 transcriptional regulator, TetR family [Cryptosporangium aurantiacum]